MALPRELVKEWDQLPALTTAGFSHLLSLLDARGKGSPVAAFGGDKPPRAHSRVEKAGKWIWRGKWEIISVI